MRILQLCNKIPYPPFDGGSVAVLSLTLSLSKLEHNITLLAMVTTKHDVSNTDRLFLEKHVKLYTVAIDTRIQWLKFLQNFLFSKEPYNAERFVSEDFRMQLVHILQSHSFDIIQLEGIYLLPYLDTIRKYSDAVIALRSHNVEHEIWRGIAKDIRNPFKKYYLNILSKRLVGFEKRFVNRYDLLVPITGKDKKLYDHMGNNMPALVCNFGYDVENLPKPNAVAFNFSLFYIGSLDWIPNQQGLFWFVSKVLPKLCKIHPGLLLYIAGRNPSHDLINRMFHPNIIFCGQVQDAREFIGPKGILVVPLFSGSGMRIKIIEAMALGKPVVATTLAAEGIDAIPDKNILLADSVDTFVKQTDKLLSSPEFYKKIGENAIKLIQSSYDNLKISSELAEFYTNHLK